jgi:hypothetical protein
MLFIVMNNPVRLFDLGSPEVVQSESPPPPPLPLETLINVEAPSPVMNMEPAFMVMNTEPGPSVPNTEAGPSVLNTEPGPSVANAEPASSVMSTRPASSSNTTASTVPKNLKKKGKTIVLDGINKTVNMQVETNELLGQLVGEFRSFREELMEELRSLREQFGTFIEIKQRELELKEKTANLLT